MDRPLLALTRRRPGALPGRSPRDAAADNMRQLIQLRWLAVAGQLVAILLARYGLGVPLPLGPMLAVVGSLAVANLVFAITLGRSWVMRGEVLLALLLDMAALTAQLYLSGGATNPFLSLYLLQVVLGAILLSPATASLLAAAAILCWAFLRVSHLPLQLPAGPAAAADLRQVGEGIGFAMIAVLLVLFIARISRNLRARDAYLAELGQRAAEEDGIVRMGLFASGAAHELSTPLSSLAVLVADWQRHPALARDAGLRAEFSDAEAEVERCKQIVTNILHSAGQLRGEAMGSLPAKALLEEVASAWASLHPDIPLATNWTAVGESAVAADPALRQAVWSLLENAADHSPGQVALAGSIDDDQLIVSVVDRGPGFTDDQLGRVGQLYRSTKGPGHGIGLFLASNVARRLGGSLSAANRALGGAEVRLVFPLASVQGDEESGHGA